MAIHTGRNSAKSGSTQILNGKENYEKDIIDCNVNLFGFVRLC